MVYNRTGKYRSRETAPSSKRTVWPLRKPKPQHYSKNPELNELLLRIFSFNNFEEDVSLSCQPIVNFLVFDYSFCHGTLTLSLSMKGHMINIIEILEEKEIIRTFKILSRKKIPFWVETLLRRFKLHFPGDVCLSNISVTGGMDSTSVFCLLLKPSTTKKKAITDVNSEANEVVSQVENPIESNLVPIQPQSSFYPSPFLVPNQQSGPMTVQEPMIVDPPQEFVDPPPRNVLVDPPPQNVLQDVPPRNVLQDVPPRNVELPQLPQNVELHRQNVELPLQNVELTPLNDQEQVLEANFKHFMRTRPISNEAFIFSHDQQAKKVTSIYVVTVENGKSAVYFLKQVCDAQEILMYLKYVEKAVIPGPKVAEFQEYEREHLNDYIFQQLLEAIADSIVFKLQYLLFSFKVVRCLDVMELIVQYKDGKRCKFMKGNKYEFPFNHAYFLTKEIAQIGDVSLKWHSLLTLSAKRWVNDDIIDSYFYLILERSKTYFHELPSVYVFNTFFLKRLQSNRVNPRKFSGTCDVFQADLLLIPANIRNVHWALYCVDNRCKTILYYDSLHMNPDSLKLIENFLNKVSVLRGGWAGNSSPPKYSIGVGKARHQENGYDCGLFVLMHADHLSRNKEFNFSQKDVPRFREQVMDELLNQKLSYECPSPKGPLNKIGKIPQRESQSPNVPIGDTSQWLNSLHSLSMPGCLNAKAVNAYLDLIAVRSKQYPDIFPSVFVFNTHFLPDLLYSRVQCGKYSAADLLKFDMLLLPFSVYSMHWSLICVKPKARTVLCYDSWRSDDRACLEFMHLIEKFLTEGVKSSKSLPYDKGFGETVKLTKSEDCCLFILLYAEYLSRHEEFNFSEKDMLPIRTQVFYELKIKKLSSPLPDICPPGFPEIPSNIEVRCKNDEFKTLNFNIAVEDIVIESYMDLLKKKCPSVWVSPDQPDESKNTLLFPFRNQSGWALVAINRCEKVLRYFNIPTTGENINVLRLITLFYKNLKIMDFTHEEMSFSEHVVDSGVYVLAISYCMALGINISFGNRHIAYLRKKIYWDLKSESGDVC